MIPLCHSSTCLRKHRLQLEPSLLLIRIFSRPGFLPAQE